MCYRLSPPSAGQHTAPSLSVSLPLSDALLPDSSGLHETCEMTQGEREKGEKLQPNNSNFNQHTKSQEI